MPLIFLFFIRSSFSNEIKDLHLLYHVKINKTIKEDKKYPELSHKNL